MSEIEAKESNDFPLHNLEDLYQLSPMQHGMLFHSIYAPESGVYFEQTIFTIRGRLDAEAFIRSWQAAVERHSILRSSFLWEELEVPQQVVHRHVKLPFENQDWRDVPGAQHEARLAEFVAEDRHKGFDLATPPLMRLALLRLADDLYRLVFSRHHLLLDRWSRSLLLKDVFAFYEALSKGEEPRAEPLRPYRDYIAWLDQQDQVAARAYWNAALKGFSAPTSLAVDSKAAIDRITNSDYGAERIQLSEESTAALQSFARNQKLTLNVLAQGAWALLLCRYSGDTDVLFGVTVAGRPATLPGVEQMVGLFINTLPLRVNLLREISVLSWLRNLQQQQTIQQQYEYSSLIDIQGASDVPRGLPLFESIFVFENLPAGGGYAPEGGDLEIRADRGLGSTTGYPLTVLVSPGARMTVEIVYDRQRFATEAVRRMLGNFQTLIESLPVNSEASICHLPILTEPEQRQILHEWNNTAVPYGGESVLSLFEEQAERTPDSPAVVFGSQQLSYRELRGRANQLAQRLRGLRVKNDDRVGICIDRGLEMAIAVLGVLKAGAGYVPLDPAYPAERLSFMLEDARCEVLLTSARVAEALPDLNLTVVRLDGDEWTRVATEDQESLTAAVEGENVAYIIYTSGSTGRPKGVVLPHRALANLISWQLENSDGPARTLQFASLSFDVSFQEMFSTWCSGGTLLLVTDELRRDPDLMLSFLAAQRVERVFLPVVYLQHLAEAFANGGASPESLREIVTAGEQLDITPEIAHFFSALKDCTLHNHYGPSESHVVSHYTLAGSPEDWPGRPPIGRPISNIQIYILDRNLQPLPVGVAGELCISGANLARGYWNRPELTAEKFIANPFSDDPAARLYRTGDLARFMSDGNIEFLGRIDQQIKIRGFRVELGEIEATLALHPSVRGAAVALGDKSGDRRLIAYVVSVVSAMPVVDDLTGQLRRFLKAKLPEYMIPANFVLLDELPLTPSGKINRRALPAPEFDANEDRESYVAPRTEVEKKLVEVWSAVLKHDRIGVRDNFFELGGHSLLATQLISRVRTAFKVELPLRRLFESPTIAALASALEESEIKRAPAPRAIIRGANGQADDLLARIDELSDADVDSLLREVLAKRGDSE